MRLEWSYARPRLALPALSQSSCAQASCPGTGVQAQAVTVGHRLSLSRAWFCEVLAHGGRDHWREVQGCWLKFAVQETKDQGKDSLRTADYELDSSTQRGFPVKDLYVKPALPRSPPQSTEASRYFVVPGMLSFGPSCSLPQSRRLENLRVWQYCIHLGGEGGRAWSVV